MSNGTQAPFLVGNVLGRGFSILFRNFIPFGTIAVVLMIPYAVVGALEALGTIPRGTAISFALQVVVGFLLPQVVIASIVFGTFQDMRGRRTGLSDAITRGFALIVPVVGVGILVGLMTVASALPAILVATAKLGGLQVLLALALFSLPVFVMVVYFVAVPAVVVERNGVGAAIGRSAELTKGQRWRVLGVLAVTWAVGIGVLLVVMALAVTAMQAGSVLGPPLMLALAVAFYYALTAVMATVTYHDLRVAREGIGTEEIARVFD